MVVGVLSCFSPSVFLLLVLSFSSGVLQLTPSQLSKALLDWAVGRRDVAYGIMRQNIKTYVDPFGVQCRFVLLIRSFVLH